MVTPEELEVVLADLRAEGAYLDAIVSDPGVDLDLPTPAPRWTIAHQIGHLLWTDRVTALACRDRVGFARQAEAFGADPVSTVNAAAAKEALRSPVDLLADWRAGRANVLDALAAVPTGTKIPWFGPSMGAATMASARIMETWAHGLDVTDALGLEPSATSRLHSVADLGVRTRDFAFSLHGSRSPSAPFRIELEAPDGRAWTWGPPSSADRIVGTALDFCLLVTQRRHRNDLALTATPGPADTWLNIAQVFAGPAGRGRPASVDA